MPAERLTLNQQETLHAIVTGNPSGMLLKPIPSLIKRRLVTQETVAQRGPPGLARPTFPMTVYRLTPLGLKTYTKARTKWHEARLKSLQEEYERDLLWAKGKTRP